jgi:hypothetical protein
MKRSIVTVAITLIVVCAIFVSGPAHAKNKATHYRVTITNLTRDQILSPAMVISHNPNFHLFMPGEPASPELAALAEDADTGPMADYLDTLPSVSDYQVADGVILPGSSATVKIKTQWRYRLISVAAMLVTTNDAFMAVKDVYARSWRPEVVEARAYDAGSEFNSELCEFIPGPPCENGGIRDEEGAEGYVYPHSGIHGIGELDPARFSWHNPVAKIVIQKAN